MRGLPALARPRKNGHFKPTFKPTRHFRGRAWLQLNQYPFQAYDLGCKEARSRLLLKAMEDIKPTKMTGCSTQPMFWTKVTHRETRGEG
jgi:hypothetical protein